MTITFYFQHNHTVMCSCAPVHFQLGLCSQRARAITVITRECDPAERSRVILEPFAVSVAAVPHNDACHAALLLFLIDATFSHGIPLPQVGNTALRLACINGYIELVKWLIAKGVNVNSKVRSTLHTHTLAFTRTNAFVFTCISPISVPFLFAARMKGLQLTVIRIIQERGKYFI
jgi:hypothetical protein